MKKTELIIPLDFSNSEAAFALARALEGLPVIYKVGLELFTAGGPSVVEKLISSGAKVFLDLKLHDIPNTVKKASAQAARLGVAMFTVHLQGGAEMLQAAREGARSVSGMNPLVLGVSVLTSFSEASWAVAGSVSGAQTTASISESVRSLVGAYAPIIDGVVCSAYEVDWVTTQHPALFSVVPGIRPEGSAQDDQARVMTPRLAHERGARAIVVGRPITQALDPRGSAQAILNDLSN